MQWKLLFEDYQELGAESVLMFYKGAISQETLVDLGSFLRSSLCGSKEIKNLFSIFVEMAHNILHYSAERKVIDKYGRGVGVGVFLVRESQDRYMISSGNLIDNGDLPDIRERVEEIHALDGEGLRRLYKERRKSGRHRTSKGAGLGLIEIARKSRQPLEVSFHDYNERFTFFSLTAIVLKGGQE